MDKLSLLKVLFAAYPFFKREVDKDKDNSTEMAYLAVLRDVPDEELAAVIYQAISTPGQFPPSAGDLMEMWHKAKGELPPEDGAERGWDSVQRAIRGVGYSGTPKFKDPIVADVVSTMGWRTLCESENEVADRAHFAKIYKAYASRKANEARMTPAYRALVERSVQQLEDKKHDARPKQIPTLDV